MNRITAYNPLPITFDHGQGIWLYDDQGKAYLDALSGIAVSGLGHAHPDVTRRIQQQAAKLLHTSNTYLIKEQLQLAEKLTSLSKMQQVFFANSGTEANEAAIKLARLFGHQKGINTPTIIVMERAFHGRTIAALSATGNQKLQAGFEPLLAGFIRVPFNDIDALRTIANQQAEIVAVMLEPIQGEGGIYAADDDYLQAVAQLCRQKDWLLILDEIQTGNGRTGSYYTYLQSGIEPDIVTTAKGLGNGVPIGACLMNHRACNLFKPGSHGSTFGGNPLACAAALTVLEVIERDNLCANAKKMGILLTEKLRLLQKQYPEAIRAIRGQGLMLGIELDRPAADARVIGLAHGILFNVTAEKVIRLLPPLIINEAEIDELVKRLTLTIEQFLQQ